MPKESKSREKEEKVDNKANKKFSQCGQKKLLPTSLSSFKSHNYLVFTFFHSFMYTLTHTT